MLAGGVIAMIGVVVGKESVIEVEAPRAHFPLDKLVQLTLADDIGLGKAGQVCMNEPIDSGMPSEGASVGSRRTGAEGHVGVARPHR